MTPDIFANQDDEIHDRLEENFRIISILVDFLLRKAEQWVDQ
jgi:hypothetical protein